ncbi:MAG: rubredoxin reductase, selenocysteine-containing [Acidimicrobiales bacterium]|nr:rubredoxin reductase, selenocysteine-containing [Acidimicrobiales bacterium]
MSERLVVIGGDAAGMTAATQARRGRDDLEIVVLEKGPWTSYSACGIPYLVSGDVDRVEDLVVRTPQEFRDKHRIDARVRHEVTAVDLDARRVEVRALEQGRTFLLGFDQLLIATGARPLQPDLPGIDQPWVRGVQTLADGAHLLELAGRPRCRDVVVVGGGYIGLEMAEAFVQRGCRVTLVEGGEQPMRTLDRDMARLVTDALRKHGVTVQLGTRVESFDQGGGVQTSAGRLPADLAVLGLGVVPNGELAASAGIELGAKDAIAVDHRQRTSASGVYAAGDCAEVFHLVSRKRAHIALGTIANKAGRVAGINIAGGYASFPGVVGTAITRVCSTEVARTGLSEGEAAEAGIEYVVGRAESTTRAGYFPDTAPIVVKVLAEVGTGRLIGGQIVGADRGGKRIDTLATAITAGMTVHQVYDLDLAYAPAVSPLWDPVQVAARRAMTALG